MISGLICFSLLLSELYDPSHDSRLMMQQLSLVAITSKILQINNHLSAIVSIIPFTDWESNAHSMTVERGQNAHYVPSL